MTLFRKLAACLVLASLTGTAQAQLPSITGTVYHDINMDGSLGAGEELMGLTLGLYADDGDGVFDADVDSLLNTKVTDSAGQYEFSGLNANTHYYVHQVAQTVGNESMPMSVSSLLNVAAFNTMIDDFKDLQEVKANPIAKVGNLNLTSSGVIGGQRDLHVEYISGPAEASLYANPYGMKEVLEFNQSAGVIAIATVTWDGKDADLSTTPVAGGLGGINITEHGNEAFAFNLGIDAAGAGEILKLRIFSGSDISTATVPLPVTDGTATILQIVPFSAFVGDADLTAVDALQLEFGGTKTSIDAQLGAIGLIGPKVHDIAVINPEPSASLIGLFALIWFAGSRRKRNR